ncbi:MAG TPA: glycosyltransferase [Streptosporangiaceae bacterium]
MPKRAVILSGSLGSGHDIVCEVVTGSLAGLGWESRALDCMSLLGPRAGRAGDWVFRRLMARPGVYDGLHFAHLRAGSRLAAAMDRAATPRLLAALDGALRQQPADLIISVFAAGVPAAAGLAASGRPGLRTIVLCPDALPHAAWVREGIDLFLVTSAAAAAGVRRYLPGARIAIIPPPLRPAFCHLAPQPEARSAVGIPPGARCVLLMGGGWGLGPVEGAARALAAAGVQVLAVAGRNGRLEARLRALAAISPRVHPCGFTPAIPELMSACDLVVTLPGALTCAEARAAGRGLVLIDAMPGHGRENVQHQLELGGAEVSGPRPLEIARSVLAALGRPRPARAGRPAADWDEAFAAALASIGAGQERRPDAVAGGPAVPGGPAVAGGAAVPGGPPHQRSAREVGYP